MIIKSESADNIVKRSVVFESSKHRKRREIQTKPVNSSAKKIEPSQAQFGRLDHDHFDVRRINEILKN